MRVALTTLALLSASWIATAQSPLSYSSLVIFGDNYSDNVNTYNATATTTTGVDSNGDPITLFDAYPSPPYGYTSGSFTNGRDLVNGAGTQYTGVWHVQLHSLLPGIPLASPALNYGQPLANDTNYAWGSATTGTGTTTVNYAGHFTVAVHNLDQQVTDYLNAGYTPNAKSLYVLFAGLNDLLQNSSAASINAAAANVTAEAKRLIDAGAVNVLIPNVPGISANRSSPVDVAATTFQTQLAADIASLESQYAAQGKNVHIVTLDLYTLYANIMASPSSFGFTDVIDKAGAVNSSGSYPADADDYLSWDGTNPTTAGHHQIALAACTALVGTTIHLTTNNPAPTVAQPATLTATVSTAGTYGPDSSLTPTGTVSFYYLNTSLVTPTLVTLGTAQLNAGGQATLSTAALSPGTYPIYAVYNGDANFPTGCNSNTLTTVVAVAAQGFDFSLGQPSYIAMEDAANVLITPVSIGGFTGNVTFSCSNLPKFFSCNFYNNQTVQVTNSGTTYYSQLSISTGTVTKLAADQPPGPLPAPWNIAGKAALASLFVAPFFLLRRRKPHNALYKGLNMLTVFLAVGLLTVSGCSSGTMQSTTSPTNTDPGLGTTHGPGITYAAPGTYSVTVTGTSGNLTVSHNYAIYIADTYDIGVTP